MMRFAGLSIVFILAVSAAQTGAQPQANAPATQNRSVPIENSSERPAAAQPPTVDDICRALEQDAAENELPVEFFARVIWQESRFNARAVSRDGAQGIAQFMPRTADWRGLADPFDPIEALRHSASYLRDLRNRFGNLGLAAAGYNAGPGARQRMARRPPHAAERDAQLRRDHHRLDRRRMGLAVAAADARTPRSRRACPAPGSPISSWRRKRRRSASPRYVPRWGAQLTANWSESRAWATYRELQKQYASLIGDREPIVLHGRLPGMGSATRYIIRIADDNRGYLEQLCDKLIAAGGACVVLRNGLGRGVTAVHPRAIKVPLCPDGVGRDLSNCGHEFRVQVNALRGTYLLVLAAELLELGEHRLDVEIVGFLLGRGLRLFLRRGGHGSRQQRRALRLDRRRLLLGGALHFEVEIDLRAQAERHRIERRRFGAFQWVRSRIAWMVDLVVPTSRMIWLSFSSG